MEGFLLAFSASQCAQVRYCVLEHGLLRCFDQPDGALLATVALTRHRIRVTPLASDGADAALCPNRFAVYTMEVRRNDQAGRFVAAAKREQVHCFAAATSKTMLKWANAIHNWRRHSFDDPLSGALSVHDVSRATRSADAPRAKRRAALLSSQRAALVSLANRFDVTLSSGDDKHKKAKKSRALFKAAAFRVRAVSKDPSGVVTTEASRGSLGITSWLPGRLASLRPSISGL